VARRALSALLNELDGLSSRPGVILLACTSQPEAIDAALLRPGRLDELFLVASPSQEDRLLILRCHCNRLRIAPDVSLPELAARTERFSGAALAALCREAAVEMLARSLRGARGGDAGGVCGGGSGDKGGALGGNCGCAGCGGGGGRSGGGVGTSAGEDDAFDDGDEDADEEDDRMLARVEMQAEADAAAALKSPSRGASSFAPATAGGGPPPRRLALAAVTAEDFEAALALVCESQVLPPAAFEQMQRRYARFLETSRAL
jgi:SpoVK/Ycf46/Vps4 family AAA+-type ATPase